MKNTTEFDVLQTFIDIKTTNILITKFRCFKTTLPLKGLF